jgi:hypothetical protein
LKESWKKIIAIFALLACHFLSSAQSVINETIDFNIPQGFKIASMDNAIKYYENNRYSEVHNPDTFKGITYMSANIVFQLDAKSVEVKEERLERLKKTFDWLSSQIKDTTYYSAIKIINGNKILITKYDRKKFSQYYFWITNKENDKVSSGIIEYTKTEEENAKEVIDYMVNNIKFK